MKGFTLIELIISILVITALATLTFSNVSDQVNARRYEETRAKMEAIRVAILGDPTVDEQGQRSRFGYIGDMGILPVTLDSLVTRGTQPVYSYDGTRGFGSGWRGPYLAEQLTTASSITKDAWGNNFTYSTSGSLTITSLGADKAVGGFLYNRDITLTIPSNQYLSSVQGIVNFDSRRIGTVAVELRYPASGTQSWVISTTNSLGAFSFANIPIGVRSIAVGTIPRPVTIDKPNTMISENTLNIAGRGRPGMGWGTQSSGNVAGGFNSPYPIPLQIEYIMLSYDRPTVFLQSFSLTAGGGESLPNLAAGVKYKLRNTINLMPGSDTIGFSFSGSMESSLFYLTLYYKANSLSIQKDVICLNPPGWACVQ